MELGEHIRITGTALKHWFKAMVYDALCVAAMWLVGLLLLHVPMAPLWAVLGGLFQFIPNVGGALTLIGPAATVGIGVLFGDAWQRLIYVLILYAVIVAIDGLVLQPMFMKRTTRVPIWASITVPIVMGIFLGFWGVLLAAPLLAVFFAYKRRNETTMPRR